ncbi:MAG: hypothetical protein ING86_03140 [Methylobacterium sp.]|nr:hypothetical protein [Methylobacterium sp.]
MSLGQFIEQGRERPKGDGKAAPANPDGNLRFEFREQYARARARNVFA